MDNEQIKGECEVCGKNPRVLLPIESGQLLCQTCRREIRPSKKVRKGFATDRQLERGKELGLDIKLDTPRDIAKELIQQYEPATEKQIAYACDLGFDVDDNLTKVKASELLDLHESAKWYIYDVWERMTGKRPKHCDMPHNDTMKFICEIVITHKLGLRIDKIQTERHNRACEIADQYGEEDYNFKDCVPHIEKDDTYRQVASLLRQRFESYLPNRGFFSRLFGNDA